MAGALFVLAGCNGAPVPAAHEATGVVASPIIGGSKSTAAHDAVVRITYEDGGTCTGTLIAPNLVVTARHCIANLDNRDSDCGPVESEIAPATMAVAVGVDAGEQTVGVLGKTAFMDKVAGCGHDLALLLLAKDIPNAKVAPVRFTKVALGEPVSTSGYGQDGVRGEPGVTGNNTDGRFDLGNLTIDFIGPGTQAFKLKSGQTLPFELEDGEIVTGESTCFGDSGGPLFDKTGAVVGTTWRGPGAECVDRPTSYSAVAAHEALIREAVKASGHSLATQAAPPKPSKPATTGGGDDDGDDDDDNAPATKPKADKTSAEPTTKKKPKTSVDASAGGCSSVPHGTRGGAPVIGALAMLLAIASRRRRPYSAEHELRSRRVPREERGG